MKKIFLFLVVILFVSNNVFSQKNLIIEQFQQQAKQTYLENADPANHKLIKSQKVPTIYEVGDTRTFWRYDFTNMPPAWMVESATCRAVGNLSYIFVADDQWDANMNQDDVDIAMSFLEDSTLNTTEYGIVAMDTLFFGAIPDEIDNDPKVVFLFSGLGQYNGYTLDGYFSAYNQMTEIEAQEQGVHSNECEMLHLSCDPVDPTNLVNLAVLAHELQHLIHFDADPDEDTWIDEGCAELAMVLFGQPDPIPDFNTDPNNNLLTWIDTEYWEYDQVMLFFTYLYEQFGADFIKSLVHNTEQSVASINATLVEYGYSQKYETIFDTWVLANFINDSEIDTGQYGYTLLDLPNFAYINKDDSYPISIVGSVNSSAARYYKIPSDYLQDFDFSFENNDNWTVNLLLYDESDILVDMQELDITQDFILLEEEWTLNKIYMTLSNHHNGDSYDAYDVNINSDATSNNELYSQDISFVNKTNSVTIIFPSDIENNAKFTVFDINGRQIINSHSHLNKGLNFIEINTETLSRGAYVIDIQTSTKQHQIKFIK